MNTKTWIVVSDKSQTRIFEKKQQAKEWEKIDVIPQQAQEGPPPHNKGVATTGSNFGTRALVDEEGMERRRYDHYYAEVSDYLNKARTQQKYADMFLVASKEVLGNLRERLDKETHKQVKKTINKDLAHYNQRELEEYLREDFIYSGNLHK